MSRSDEAQPGPGAFRPERTHPAIEEQLAAYTAGELQPAERQRIQAHLAACGSCSAALAEVQRIRWLLHTLAVPGTDTGAPATVADGVMARLSEPSPNAYDALDDLWPAQNGDDGDDVALAWDLRPVSRQDGVVSAAQRPTPPAESRRGWDRAGRWQLDGASAGESFQMQRRNARVADEPYAGLPPTRSVSGQMRPKTPPKPFVRARGLSAVAATLAIVGLSAALFGMLSARHGAAPGSGPTSIFAPGTTPTPTPAMDSGGQLRALPGVPGGGYVSSVWMDGPNDGWAVGTNQNETAGIVLHYTGGRWVPAADSFPGVLLTDVSIDTPEDGWAVGAHWDAATGVPTGVVLHYTGGHWTEVKAPITQFAGAKVWAISPSQAWVVADLPANSQQGFSQSSMWLSSRSGGIQGSLLLHYNQGNWSEFNSPSGIANISPLSPDDIWAVSSDDLILHFQAGRWTQYPIGGLQGGQPEALYMTSDSEGWAVGFCNVSPQGVFLAHFDGNTWTRVHGPASTGPTDLRSIDMVSAGEGWAGGDVVTSSGWSQTILLHYAGGRWQQVPLNYIGGIESIFMVSPTEGWAAVSGGRTSGLLHYHNGKWTPYDPGQ